MSRLREIVDNHHQLSDLNAIVRHYGLSAEFVATALLEQCQQQLGSSGSGSDDGGNGQGGNKGKDDSKQQDDQKQNEDQSQNQNKDQDQELSEEDKLAMQEFIEDLQQFIATL